MIMLKKFTKRFRRPAYGIPARLWHSRQPEQQLKPLMETVPAVSEVLLDEVDHSQGRSVGPLFIGHTFWQRLGFPELLAGSGSATVRRPIIMTSPLLP